MYQLQRGKTFLDFNFWINLTLKIRDGELFYLQLRAKLRRLYGHPGNIDVWVGGLLETVVPGGRVGPTVSCLLIDQFRRLRDGDRFWYESPSVFTPGQLSQVWPLRNYLPFPFYLSKTVIC